MNKLHPLYFPVIRRCCGCQRSAVACAVQIAPGLRDRQRYFCCDCAIARGVKPAKALRINKIEDLVYIESVVAGNSQPRSRRR